MIVGGAVFEVDVPISGGDIILGDIAIERGVNAEARVWVNGATVAGALNVTVELDSEVLIFAAFVVVSGGWLISNGANPVRDVAI